MRTEPSRTRTGTHLAVWSAAAIGALILSTATTAAAQEPAGAVERPAGTARSTAPAGAVVRPMTVTGVDRAVAEAHGFTVVTGPNGRQHVVPTASAVNPDGTPYSAAVRPRNEVEGNCGDSYLYIHSVGGYVSEIETGFDLTMGAVAYHWQVNRSDNWGSDSHSWGGGLGVDEHWHGEWDVRSGGATWETAGVVPASNVLLWDGEVCHAGAPSDTTWVF